MRESIGWHLAMVIPGLALFFTGCFYYRFTKDSPDGNYADLRGARQMDSGDSAVERFGMYAGTIASNSPW
jgi:NNP family nitrate/nitrite transporter-like MFS transporter